MSSKNPIMAIPIFKWGKTPLPLQSILGIVTSTNQFLTTLSYKADYNPGQVSKSKKVNGALK